MGQEKQEVAILTGGPPRPALDLLLRSAVRGVQGAGADAYLFRPDEGDPAHTTEQILDCDALLVAAPVVLYGLPGDVKSLIDSWLELVGSGRLTPRTARMRVGYLTVYAPDDAEILETFHAQMKRVFSFFGMSMRGRVAGFAAEGASEPQEGHLVALAERLGVSLAEEGGSAVGYAPGYLAGADLFNRAEFYEAHEAWEEVWHEDEGPYKDYYQGLIQVAAGLHHYGRENWGGMAGLMDQATEKLRRYLPRTLGVDVEAFLDVVDPWHQLALTRVGRGGPTLRTPTDFPQIEIDKEQE